ncbi:hypothetical protein [Sinorhizobium fredii]|uniref:hypothetical protein n=1 Tax=Rhizobium fredii TaxID=380 RepID=UPI0012951DCC|nr:hypothetical protein [Sinorhizobium fredii]MQW99621.1 hypothetical protein [Sinorhizobium fredii]
MSTYRIENEDGGLAPVSDVSGDHLEWLDDIEIVGFPSESEIVVRVTLCDSNDSNLFAWHLEGAEDIRKDMAEWLEDNGYSVSIPCDFGSQESLGNAAAAAQGLHNRFVAGDYTPLDAVYKTVWSSSDRRGDIEGLEHHTLDAALDSLSDFAAELLRQCADDAERNSILAGTFEVYRGRGSWSHGWQSIGDFESFYVEDFAPLPAAA